MKQVININFQGRVVPIEVSAFDILKQYTESLNRHFANEEGKDEIINDIESRIGELFQERLTNGATCITDDDVNAVIKSMGRPEEFEDAEEGTGVSQPSSAASSSSSSSQQQSSASSTHKRLYRDENNKILGGVCAGIANYFNIDSIVVRILFVVSGVGFFAYILLWAFVPSSSDTVIGGVRKKLYRDSDDKIVAGVCSGLGNYFGINAWIPRVLFLLPFLSFVFRWNHWGAVSFPDFVRLGFSPGSLIIYIILWLVIPEAFTTAEKLEMKGSKVDIDSIKNSVKEEIKGVQQRAQKFSKEASSVVADKTKAFTAEAGNVARRGTRSLGDFIALILKIFGYIVIGFVCVILVIGLFALGIVSIGLFPLKDFIIDAGWENVFAWGTLLFFIAVPIIGIITWIIRRLAKARGNRKMIRLTFGSLWVVGWICMILLLASISKNFDYNNSRKLVEQDIVLSNPLVSKLEVSSESPLEKYAPSSWLRIEPFAGIQDDTAFIKNVDVRVMKAGNDSFKITTVKIASGRSIAQAENLANMIQFSGVQKDTLLQLDKGIAINKTDKFRNQQVILTIYVPVGKHIKINRSVTDFDRVHFGWDGRGGWGYDNNKEAHGWENNKECVMGADGNLYTLDGKRADEYRSRHERNGNINNNDTTGRYHYNNNKAPMNKADSLKAKRDLEIQRFKDSIRKLEQQGGQGKINDDEDNDHTDEPVSLNSSKFPGYGPMITID